MTIKLRVANSSVHLECDLETAQQFTADGKLFAWNSHEFRANEDAVQIEVVNVLKLAWLKHEMDQFSCFI